MKQIDFKLNGLVEYTDSAIIAEIKRVAEIANPKPITFRVFERHANVGKSTVRRHFGTWRNALAAAGLSHLINNANVITEKMIAQRGKGMSEIELLSVLRGIAHKLGKQSLTVDEFNQHAPINAATLRTRFHGWSNAIQRAGLTPAKIQCRYSDDECFENLLKVWTHYGRPPKYEEMPHPPSTISVTAYKNRWGTWRKTLKAFVDRINQDVSAGAKDNQIPEGAAQNDLLFKESCTEHRKPDSEKRAIKLGLRYEVFKRDRFRCVICGRSPATALGVELQADHIIPFSRGGKTILENLRSTCSECNLGKGAKIENAEPGSGLSGTFGANV